MKIIAFLLVIFSQTLLAHEGHHAELKASAPLAGNSIFQLDSTWKNKNNKDVKLTDLRGKGRLVVMLFTRCETACPLIVEDLKEIVTELQSKQPGRVEVSIFSLDSFRDTPESLQAFSVKRKLPSHWNLFTSDADAVAELAASLGVKYKRLQNGDFIHSNAIYFINKSGELIAQKEGLKTPRTEFIKKIKKNL